ncbi:MAG: hypothetical protein IJS89_06695 [Bacteroidaceae bacterium]|nr:hypothetical protein [Bacteroidaceae bacterium]
MKRPKNAGGKHGQKRRLGGNRAIACTLLYRPYYQGAYRISFLAFAYRFREVVSPAADGGIHGWRGGKYAYNGAWGSFYGGKNLILRLQLQSENNNVIF